MISALFYPLFLFSSLLFLYAGDKYRKSIFNLYILIFLVIFSFIFGVRVNFGIDQPVYQRMYEKPGVDLFRCEPIFVRLNLFLHNNHFSTAFYFSVLSFLNILFLYLSMKKEKCDLCLSFIVYFSIYIFYYVNISRQAIAMNICLLSLFYFADKKYIKWLILVFLAAGFHTASLSFLIMIPILKFTSKLKIPELFYYICFAFAFLMFEKLYDIIMNGLFLPFNLITGGRYSFLEKFLTYKLKLGSGMGVRLRILGYTCLLPELLDCRKQNPKTAFYFSIFFFGIFGEFVASVNMNLVRVFYFFTPVQIILIAKTLPGINKKNIFELKKALFCFGLLIIFILFVINAIKGINNTAIYTWCFDF